MHVKKRQQTAAERIDGRVDGSTAPLIFLQLHQTKSTDANLVING